MIGWRVSKDETGLTVLALLRRRLPAAPAGYLRQLLRSGRVICDGEPVQDDRPLQPGQSLSVPESRRIRQLLDAAPPVQILHETREILAVFKPAGLAVHRGQGHEADNLVQRVQALLQARGNSYQAAPAHRLDAPTSGPVLFGKGRRAIAALGELFMAGRVEKRYLGLAAGRMTGEAPLVSPVFAKGKVKEAISGYRVLGTARGFSLLELSLQTGRTHQLRRQLAELGHPLAGDRRYGGPPLTGLARLFLHCHRLILPDPFGGPRLVILSPLPEDLAAPLRAIGLSLPPAADLDEGGPP